MPTVIVAKERVPNGVSLYYETHGDGSNKVLLIMGLSASLRAWEIQIQFFSKLPDFQLCVFDNRGIGRSSSPSGRYTTSEMSKDTLELINHLGWKSFHIIGISMGGMISQELALLAPNKVQSLALISTHSGGLYAIPPWKGISTIRQAQKTTDLNVRASLVIHNLYPKEFLESLNEHGEKHYDVLARAYLERIKLDGLQTPQGAYGQSCAALTHYVSTSRFRILRDAGIPILIMTGDTDNLVKPRNSELLRDALKPAEFIYLKGIGHGIIYQAKDIVNQALLKNIQRAISSTQLGKEEM